MNWEAIGAVAEAFAAIGVIATLGYLAVQIRQNSKLIKLSNTYQILDASRQSFLASLAQINVPAVIAKSRSGELLSDEELIAYRFWFNAQMRNFENAFLQHQSGALEDEVLSAIREKVRSAFSSGQALSAWRISENQAIKGYRDWVNGIIDSDA